MQGSLPTLLALLSLVFLLQSPFIAVQGRNAAPSWPFTDIDGGDAFAFDVLTADPTLPISVPMFPSVFTGTSLPISTAPGALLDVDVMLPHSSDDPAGCNGNWRTTNEFQQNYTGKFILVTQNPSCTSSLQAVASGAAGILLQGCSPLPPFNCNPRLQNDYTFVMINIPVLVIRYTEGQQLREYLQAQNAAASAANTIPPTSNLRIRLKSTGNIVPEERQALIAIMTQTTMGEFAVPVPAPLPFWTLAMMQDLSRDPCRVRTKGLWCEDGHVVAISLQFHNWKLNGNNPIPPEFGAFTKLRSLIVETNYWYGPIPDAWCTMTDLRVLMIGTQLTPPGITRLPNCEWVNMTGYHFEKNAVTDLPANFVKQTKMVNLYGFGNKLTAVPSLANWDKLEIIDISSNAITGSFPALSPVAPIKYLGGGTNKFSSLPIGTFDGMSKLEILDLNTNSFTGALPTLSGCTALKTLDLSSQRDLTNSASVGFSSAFPTQWKNLVNLVTLNLQENSIKSPVFVGDMIRCQSVDLSHNKLTRATEDNPNNNDFDVFLATVLGSSLVTAKLSYNPTLAGSMDAWTTTITKLQLNNLYLDHCAFTNLAGEIFVMNLIIMDASYNNISDTVIAGVQDSPKAAMRLLNLVGNPYFHVDPLPSWVAIQPTRVQQPGESYACAPLKATTAPLLDMEVDPSWYSYKYCECQPGKFGRAPACSVIPSSAELNPNRIITSEEIGMGFPALIQAAQGLASQLTYTETNATTAIHYSQAFSDTMYGSTGRLMPGLSTSWVIDLTDLFNADQELYAEAGETFEELETPLVVNTTKENPPTMTTPVRVLTIRLHVSGSEFVTFDDAISIYEGGTDLKGDRVFTIRGTDKLPSEKSSSFTLTEEYLRLHNSSISTLIDPRLIEVQVLSNKATVQFNNRQENGRHLYGTYSYSFHCPEGYFYDRISNTAVPKCRLNYNLYQVSSGIRGAVYAVSAVALAWVTFNIIVLVWQWESLVFKAASRSFMLLVLLLLEAQALGALLYAGVPSLTDGSGKALCIGRAWLTCLPLVGILAVILAKTARLNTIFNARTLQVQKQSDWDILAFVSVISALQIVLLGVFTGLPLSRPELALGHGGLSDRLVTSCSQERGFMDWFGAEIAFISCLILPAAYLGFKTRDLPSQYNESTHIQNAVVLMAFFGVIIIPLDVFIQDDPGAAVLIQGLGQAFLCIMLTSILFGPKLYFLTQVKSSNPVAGAGTKMNENHTMVGDNSSELPTTEAPNATRRASVQSRVSSGKLTTPAHGQSAAYPKTALPKLSAMMKTTTLPSTGHSSLSNTQTSVNMATPPNTAVDHTAIKVHVAEPGSPSAPSAPSHPISPPPASPMSTPQQPAMVSPRRKIHIHGNLSTEMASAVQQL